MQLFPAGFPGRADLAARLRLRRVSRRNDNHSGVFVGVLVSSRMMVGMDVGRDVRVGPTVRVGPMVRVGARVTRRVARDGFCFRRDCGARRSLCPRGGGRQCRGACRGTGV